MSVTPIINRARKGLSYIWLFLFVVAFTFYYVYNTMLISSVRNAYVDLALSYCVDLVQLITFLSILVNGYSQWLLFSHRRVVLVCLVKLIIFVGTVLFMRLNSVYDYRIDALGVLVFFAISSDEQTENRLIGTGFCLGAAYTVVLFVITMLGFVENNRGNAFGFKYSDNIGCFILCLSLFYCMLRDGWLTWIGELVLLALPFVCLRFNDAKTALICGLLLFLCTSYRHYRRIGGPPYQDKAKYGSVIPLVFRALYCPIRLASWTVNRLKLNRYKNALLALVKYGYILCGGLFIAANLTYRQLQSIWKRIPGIGTVVSRLYLGQIGFEEFPVRLFGNQIPQIGFGGSESAQPLYFVFDSGYVKILLQYGIIIFIIVIGLMTWTQFRLHKHRRYYASFLLFLFALDTTMEYQISNFVYNLFILLAFCRLSDKQGVEACENKRLLPARKSRRIALVAVSVTLVTIFTLWCVTAYQIISWRGWTPNYASTVVVPGAYVDEIQSDSLREPRLTRAISYLNSHKDARCIVDNPEDRDWFAARNVDADRITVSQADTVDEMLLNASLMIEENDMPPRLTVCTYDIQQARIQEHAKALHIPINSLTMKMPLGQYLRNFAMEQWSMLCRK